MNKVVNPKRVSTSGFYLVLTYWIFLGFLTLLDGWGSPWLLPLFCGVFPVVFSAVHQELRSMRKLFAILLGVYLILLVLSFFLVLEKKPGYITYSDVTSPEKIWVYLVLFSVPAVVFVAIFVRLLLSLRSENYERSEKSRLTEMPTRAALFGAGVFTTLAVRKGELVFWEKHLRRLVRNARSLGIDLAGKAEISMEQAVKVAVANHRLDSGRVRITISDQRPSELWPSVESYEEIADLQIVVGDPRNFPERFKLATSPFPVSSRSPLAGVKSCNYLEQILSLDEAKGRGFHEAVRVNERGHVTCGCMSNIFWLKNDRLYTPTLATGCLAGTTREYVLENVECEEVEAEIEELKSADAIYLTSAGLGILRVAEYDGRELSDITHPIQTLWPPS